jgi:hypothetical protein
MSRSVSMTGSVGGGSVTPGLVSGIIGAILGSLTRYALHIAVVTRNASDNVTLPSLPPPNHGLSLLPIFETLMS